MATSTVNPENLRAALAYARDAVAHGRFETPLGQYHRLQCVWRWLNEAGACFKGEKFGLYPLRALMHHADKVFADPGYSRRVWSLAVYEKDVFVDYARQAKITRELRGSLFVAHAEANTQSLLATHGRERLTIKFEKIKAVDIPADGYWVMVVYDVDNKLEEPELVYHRYTLTNAEVKTINTATGPVVLPLALADAHHVHQLRSLGLETPRLLLRLEPARSHVGWLSVREAALEAHMQPQQWTTYTRTAIGDTLQSMSIDADSDSKTPNASGIVDELVKRHRVVSYAGFWTTREGQTKLGAATGADGTKLRSIASSAVGEYAVYRTVISVLDARRVEIEAKLDTLDPRSGTTEAGVVARDILNDRLGVEALFVTLSPQGRASPVLAELKRIFGDKGVPTLGDMLSGDAGLPLAVQPDAGQEFVDEILAVKIDMASARRLGVSEEYAARMLSRVRAPVWQAAVSPLTLAVLVSVMPETFAADVQRTIRETFDMPYTVLRHAHDLLDADGRVQWQGRTSPGVYTEGPLDDYERLARRLAGLAPFSASNQAMATVVPDKTVTSASLNALEPGLEYPARALVVRGVAPAMATVVGQREALARISTPNARVKFDPSRVMAFHLITGLTNDGQSLMIAVNRSSAQSMVMKFDASPDHRWMFALDLVGAMALSIDPASYTGGPAAWGALQMAVSRSRAFDAYADEGRASSQPDAAGDNTGAPMLARMVELLRNAMRQNHAYVNVSGSVDSGQLGVQAVSDDNKTATLRYTGHYDSAAPISTRIGTGVNDVSASEARVAVNDNVANLSLIRVGPTTYIRSDQLELLAAAQNEAASKRTTIVEENADFHDPYNLASTAHMSKIDALNGGRRRKLIDAASPLVVDNVGITNARGLMMTPDQRNDPSRFYAGNFASRDMWYNPYV